MEIKATDLIIEKSFDEKHELQFNEKSHRYKLNSKPCVGTTTFVKAAMPTSIGLTNWMKTQTAIALLGLVSDLRLDGSYHLNQDIWPIDETKKGELFKAATTAHEEVAREAADIGTITHSYAELHSLGKIMEAEALLDKVRDVEKWPVIESCVMKYVEWSSKNAGTLCAAEKLIASVVHSFCGKFDRIDDVNHKFILRDYKTSKAIFLDQFVQLGAYAIAIEEWLGIPIDGMEVLRFGKEDGAFETLLIDDPKEIQIFKDQAIRCRQTYEFLKMNSDERFDWKKRK